MKLGIVVFTCLMILLLPLTVTAQSQDDLLDAVQTALDHFSQQTSYQITGLQSVQQAVTITGGDVTTTIEQSVEQHYSGALSRDAENIAAQMTIEQMVHLTSDDNEPLNFSQTLDIIILEDNLYMQVSDVQPEDVVALLPAGWVNLTENPDAFPGAELMNGDQYISLFTSAMNFLLTEDMLLTIDELESETIEGQTMRVIEVTFDPALLLDSGALDGLFNAYDYAMLGLNNEVLAATVGQNAQVTTTLWLTPENDLYRADSALSFAGEVSDTVSIDSEIGSSFVYTDFGEPVNIEAPIS
ncbi:MAG: hypothetical protein K8L99_35800 [Anaerolineae bacterium]|nr:hypothetical protein [Anaerolineae bacterium]